jgi:5-formyltetrahydrofolate cyclo-ligase
MARPRPDRSKQEVREDVWAALSAAGVARFPGARGRIPNFTGAERAAERLAGLDEWRAAEVLKCNPDLPQLPVRARALADGKTVYLAVPKLRTAQPFLLLDPDRLTVKPRAAASIKGSAEQGRPVGLEALDHIDLVVCGTVAVNALGVRIGKGGGFSDLEYALGVEAGVIDDATTIVTTVHPLQVIDGDLPETDHDFRVDVVVTPDEVIRCGRRPRPRGVLWDHLDDEKIAAIPVLAERRPG